MTTEYSVADAIVDSLAASGVRYFFGNAGTDFPPLIEAFAKAQAQGRPAPTPVLAPHENTAITMAHGYAAATGDPQAVMVHTTVGTANALCGLINAARENIPVLFFAGRTPISEGSAVGARNLFIHWPQEAFDQAGSVREYVKWEYELRQGTAPALAVERGLAIAKSEPLGPVYLTLPREILAGPAPTTNAPVGRQRPAAAFAPDPDAIEEAARILAAAEAPLIVTARVGKSALAIRALDELAREFSIPVCAAFPRYVCLPSDHPMYLGFARGNALKVCDAVLLVDCDVPWSTAAEAPPATAPVIHLGADPLETALPMRSFRADVIVGGTTALALPALGEALRRKNVSSDRLGRRRRHVESTVAELRRTRAERLVQLATAKPIAAAYLAHCLDLVKGHDAVVVNEVVAAHDNLSFHTADQFFSLPAVGGLGWGLGAALGVKLANPNRLVIACVGDGSYLFGNPAAAHMVGEAQQLPFLTVIFNNRLWASVGNATRAMYPDGYAVRSNRMALTHLEPAPRYELYVQASGGFGIQVSDTADLLPALRKAVAVVREERRQAVVNVLTG
ncbi:MAG: thiamine pyrophosphate-requiring protein [Alphaproteobacteria bacterium]|nr:thiamine pyrophosphate-requiring protein [Alphaproteobacteria bacterium]